MTEIISVPQKNHSFCQQNDVNKFGEREKALYRNMNGIRKVGRPIHLQNMTCRIFSLFNILCCNQNALGPAFLDSSDFVVKELLTLLMIAPPATACHLCRH